MDFQRAASTQVSVDHSRTTSLNDRLNTNYVDFGGAEGNSYGAQYTKTITDFVGEFVTPRQLLVLLRVLKAVTFVFLILTLAANMMYIVFLEVLATREVRNIVGGRRDMIIRVYGLFLSGVALAIEVDVAWVVKVRDLCFIFILMSFLSLLNTPFMANFQLFFGIAHNLPLRFYWIESHGTLVAVQSFYGFKGFLARSFLLFFISAITGANPLFIEERNQMLNQNVYYDDDAMASVTSVPDLPMSVVVFQRVTSFFLYVHYMFSDCDGIFF